MNELYQQDEDLNVPQIRQGCFSYLPPLNRYQINNVVSTYLSKGHAILIEYTADPHPFNTYWQMWGQKPFFAHDGEATILSEIENCQEYFRDFSKVFIKVSAFDNTRGIESTSISFLIQTPTYMIHDIPLYASEQSRGAECPEYKIVKNSEETIQWPLTHYRNLELDF